MSLTLTLTMSLTLTLIPKLCPQPGIMRQFGQMGLLGLTVPAEHGGGAQHANPTPSPSP